MLPRLCIVAARGQTRLQLSYLMKLSRLAGQMTTYLKFGVHPTVRSDDDNTVYGTRNTGPPIDVQGNPERRHGKLGGVQLFDGEQRTGSSPGILYLYIWSGTHICQWALTCAPERQLKPQGPRTLKHGLGLL